MGPPLSRVDRGIDPHAQYFVAFQVSDPEVCLYIFIYIKLIEY